MNVRELSSHRSREKTINAAASDEVLRTVPVFGKDEMNLVEFPLGPITPIANNTMEVEHQVWDRGLRRAVTRRMVVTGSAAFGLPRPIDDQVLIGMKSLSHEAGYASRTVEFSRYHLCRIIGWNADGRAYRRLEASLDRIAGTTLKFRDAWWDKGEQEWKSRTFHLIEEVDLCSRDRLDRRRASTGKAEQQLCSFVWSEVIWKSFQDGFIKTLDMALFRRIATGRRREVPLRLFRILDKRFHYGDTAKFDLRRLCVGTLGLNSHYSPSQMLRILQRATDWLVECGYLAAMDYSRKSIGSGGTVVFCKRPKRRARSAASSVHNGSSHDAAAEIVGSAEEDAHKSWLSQQTEDGLLRWETAAIAAAFGSELERNIVQDHRSQGTSVFASGRIRQQYIRRYATAKDKDAVSA